MGLDAENTNKINKTKTKDNLKDMRKRNAKELLNRDWSVQVAKEQESRSMKGKLQLGAGSYRQMEEERQDGEELRWSRIDQIQYSQVQLR